MHTLPNITITNRDAARLETLLEGLPAGSFAGLKALEDELYRATLVDPEEIPPTVVTMNSTVEFINDQSGQKFEMTLVYPDAVSGSETVSIFAPVGSALLGLSVGQSISWQMPGGRELNLRVLQVVRQPEAMGEYHR